uniref:uncharacterized protein LOC108950530 n=1 Tax=Ciona intestinalis TaxID=7719 RepID=UPI00089DAC02
MVLMICDSDMIIIHFEASQFYLKRGKTGQVRLLLRNDAVPTLFDIPNCPKPFSKTNPRRKLKRKAQDNKEPRRLKLIKHDHTYTKVASASCCFVESYNSSAENIISTNLNTSSHVSDYEVENQSDTQASEACATCKQLQLEVRRLKWKIAQLTKKSSQQMAKLSSFLNEDQLSSLSKNSKGQVWSDETIKKCLQIRCTTGAHGYEFLRKLSFPIPSYRTLCRRVSALKFPPGIEQNIIKYMGMMFGTANMDDNNKPTYCSLVLDEMQIREGIEFDLSLKRFLG